MSNEISENSSTDLGTLPDREQTAYEKVGMSMVPGHQPRHTDFDPRAATRAERQVAILFGLSAICTVLFVVSYIAFDPLESFRVPFLGTWSSSNASLGVTFGMAMVFLGAGVMQWAKKLMSDKEWVQQRHEFRADDTARAEAITMYEDGVEDSSFVSRPILRRSMLGAMALFPVPLIVILRDLGPMPENTLTTTAWTPGLRIVTDPQGAPIKPSDIPIGGIVMAMPVTLPEIQHEDGNMNTRAKDVVILIRLDPDDIVSQQGGTKEDPWDYEGILCFSKICPHVGCPISLYEQRTHHLLCPCHQSTFDLANGASVIFGPAARPLPQLPIRLDLDGYLVAQDGFDQPVGPSYWERA